MALKRVGPLNTVLQDIYRNRSRLIVVFLGADYQRKDWCGVEFRAIRDIIMARENQRVMFIRVDDCAVEGVFRTDGYVDARRFSPTEIAQFIAERIALNCLGVGQPARRDGHRAAVDHDVATLHRAGIAKPRG